MADGGVGFGINYKGLGRVIGVRAAEHLNISAERSLALAKHIMACESCFCVKAERNPFK